MASGTQHRKQPCKPADLREICAGSGRMASPRNHGISGLTTTYNLRLAGPVDSPAIGNLYIGITGYGRQFSCVPLFIYASPPISAAFCRVTPQVGCTY